MARKLRGLSPAVTVDVIPLQMFLAASWSGSMVSSAMPSSSFAKRTGGSKHNWAAVSYDSTTISGVISPLGQRL
jgi:hypothetical protein